MTLQYPHDFLYLCIIGCYFTSAISYFICILSLCFLMTQTKVSFVLLFRTTASLLTFHLDDLLIDVTEVLKSPTITVFPSISPFLFVSIYFMYLRVLTLGLSGVTDGKESAGNVGDPGSIPRKGRSLGEGNCNPLQYSCLENSMDRGVWWAIVSGVTKSQTQLCD